ncbi:triple tyrosine motif-containing protein, partial [Cecembia rubra]|uniref:sensor histidine kinase n=1 Tax=Cecembia rubra TaxID=1485585 RepID=UPI002714AE56
MSHQLHKISLFLFLSFWLNAPLILFAQSSLESVGKLPLTTYLPEDYNGQPRVLTSVQSDDGLMYFGLDYGLLEYDGVSWRPVLGDDASIIIRTLAKDPSGRIFYGGQDRFGYLELDPFGVTRSVSLFHLIPEDFLPVSDFWTIHFMDGFIFLQSRKYLFRLELEADFSLKSLKTWTAETGFGYAFLQDSTIFLHQIEKGLYKLDGDEIVLVPGTEVLGRDRLLVMQPFPGASQPSYLLGSFTSGFYVMDREGLRPFPSQIDPFLEKGAILYRGLLLEDGNYALAFLGVGVVIMNPKGEIIRRINSEHGLQSDTVFGIYPDQSKGLWIITENGMARADVGSPVLTYGKDEGVNFSVISILKKRQEMYLGTRNGLLRFDPLSNKFKVVPEINSLEVLGMRVDGEDIIVAGQQLNVLRDGKVISLENPKSGTRPIYTLIPKDNPNMLYVATSTGLSVYSRGLSSKTPWEYVGDVPGIDRFIFHFFEDKDGDIWTPGLGVLFQFSPKEKGLRYMDLEDHKVKSFDIGQEAGFYMIDGEIYLFNAEGMQKFSKSEGRFVKAKEFEAVEGKMIDFNESSFGRVWIETKEGKVLLNRLADGTYEEDKTPSAINSYLSLYNFLDEDGIIWFGTTKGLVRFDPKKDNQADKPFFTLLRRIETKTDTLELVAYGRNKNISARELKANSLRFEFAAPFYEDEKKTRYQTFLEGFDSDWVDWNDNKFKEYTNLSPGEYTFHVRAMAHTGRISEEASYSFVVLPPWYATWWAYLIYALLIGGIITAIIKWRSKKLKAENRILEERVNERTAALEKSLAELKSAQAQLIQSEKMASLGELTAGIAHEIQNPLNFVNNFSEVNKELVLEAKDELGKGNIDEAKNILGDIVENSEKINHHGKRAESIVKGMLQHSRTGSGKKELTDL